MHLFESETLINISEKITCNEQSMNPARTVINYNFINRALILYRYSRGYVIYREDVI